MGLPSGFPFYYDGKHHVSLSFPALTKEPSKISQSVGITASYPLLLPNMDFLKRFAKGDLGIADKILLDSLFRNFNHPITQKNPEVFKAFARITGVQIDDIEKYKKNGRYKIPKQEIQVPKVEGVGFNGFEKSFLTSIFETQKPYIEVAQSTIKIIAKAEDIVARVMPLLSPNPLDAESQIPRTNAGIPDSRPKALGFADGQEIKNSLAEMASVSKSGGEVKLNKDGSFERTKNKKPGPTASGQPPAPEETPTGEKNFEIVSAVYSTGVFNPEVDYAYTYIDLPADDEVNPKPEDLNLGDDGDPYKKYKPKSLIFGIFDSQGKPINPAEKLKSIGISSTGVDIIQETTPFSRASWLLESPKWKFQEGAYIWPSFGKPIFQWQGTQVNIGQTRESITKPDTVNGIDGNVIGDWEIKKYKRDETNKLSGLPAVEDAPIIVGFEPSEVSDYSNFMAELVDFRLHFAKGLEQQEKNDAKSKILGQLNVQSHLENVNLYGQSKSSLYTKVRRGDEISAPASGVNIPEEMKLSLKPYQINIPQASTDPKLKEYAEAKGKTPGNIWIDPEADYEVKIIRVDPTTSIEYEEAQGAPEVKATVKSFIKNRTTFKVLDGRKFDIIIKKNNGNPTTFTDVTEYVLDNWNYEKPGGPLDPQAPVLKSLNSYVIKIKGDKPTKTFETRNSYIKSDGVYKALRKVGTDWYYKEFTFSFPSETTAEYDFYTNNFTYENIPAYYENYINNREITVPYRYSDTDYNIKLKLFFEDKIIETDITSGDKQILENSIVQVNSLGKVIKWIYLEKTYDKNNLPLFGKDLEVILDSTRKPDADGNLLLINNTKDLPKFTVNVENSQFPYGKVIDPTKITNEALKTSSLFSTGRYGHGSPNNPQDLEIIKRYMLTDLDTETYYIIEGVLTDENKQNKQGGAPAGGGEEYYRLPHAVGAIRVFINLLCDIFSDLIPQIKTLTKLLNNPSQFVTDIIKEKLKQSFNMFSDQSIDAFASAIQIARSGKEGAGAVKQGFDKSFSGAAGSTVTGLVGGAASSTGNLVSDVISGAGSTVKAGSGSLGTGQNSLISSNLTSSLGAASGQEVKDKINSMASGQASNFSGGQARISDKIEQLKSVFKESPLKDHVYVDQKARFKFLLDGVAMIPFEIFGKQIPFGMQLNMSGLADSKPPIGLVLPQDLPISRVENLQQFFKSSLKDYKGPGSDGKSAPITVSDLKDAKAADNLDTSYPNKSKNPNDTNDYQVLDIKYSTGEYIKGVDYQVLYTNTDNEKLIKDVDALIATNQDLSSNNEAKALSDKLSDSLAKSPDDAALKQKKKELLEKMSPNDRSTQPLIKALLGLVTLPLKIAGSIIEKILDLFSALANPTALPAKITEFLSFSWMLNLFTPKGLLTMAGIEFNPEVTAAWAASAAIPNPAGVPKGKVPTGFDASAVDKPESLKYKDATSTGRFSVPDNFDLADFSKFFKAPMIATLPTYTSRQFRERPERPFKLFSPFICMFEKILNGIIDFFWSTFGIEALLPAPKINLCNKEPDPDTMDPEDVSKLQSGEKPKKEPEKKEKDGKQTSTTNPLSNGDPSEAFEYEITLSDGKVVKGLDFEAVKKFQDENKDLDYNFQI